MSVLSPLGYKLIYAEDYTFEEQILLFHNAKKIIGFEGSNLTNIVFCNTNACLLEIMPSIRKKLVHKNMANQIGMGFIEYLVDDNDAFEYYDKKKDRHRFDVKIDIEKFKPYVEKLENF